jgi:hypothetical protein
MLIVTMTRSIGKSSRLAIASMMRMFAWCGISQSSWSLLMPLAFSVSMTSAPSVLTATL